jgi:hypothetical protein
MNKEVLDATALVRWAWQTLSLLVPVPADAVLDIATTDDDLAHVMVTVGGISSGFGLDLELPSEQLLNRFAYFLSDPLVEESGGAWPPCPIHGDRHTARITWDIQMQRVGCEVRCERDKE